MRRDVVRRWIPVLVPIILVGGYLGYRAVLNATRHHWSLALVDVIGILIVTGVVFCLSWITRLAEGKNEGNDDFR